MGLWTAWCSCYLWFVLHLIPCLNGCFIFPSLKNKPSLGWQPAVSLQWAFSGQCCSLRAVTWLHTRISLNFYSRETENVIYLFKNAFFWCYLMLFIRAEKTSGGRPVEGAMFNECSGCQCWVLALLFVQSGKLIYCFLTQQGLLRTLNEL